MDDLNSELDELQEAVEEEDPQSCFEELGDVLFSAVNVARFLQVDAEESLNASTQKFIARVQKTRAACRPARTGLKGSVDPGAGGAVEAGQGRMLKQPSSLQADEKRKDHLNGG